MNPIYLRKERTTEPYTLRQPAPLAPSQRDVVAYLDPEATERAGRWPWLYSSKPTRRNNYITLNCVTRPVVWLADAE